MIKNLKFLKRDNKEPSVSLKSLVKRLEYSWKCDGRLGCGEASVFCSGKCYACISVVLGEVKPGRRTGGIAQ